MPIADLDDAPASGRLARQLARIRQWPGGLPTADASCPKSAQLMERVRSGQMALSAAMKPVPRVFTPQEAIVAAGDQPDCVYRVSSGWVAEKRSLADGRVHIRSFLLPGDSYGFGGLLLNPMSYSLEALAPTSVEVIPHREVIRLAAENADIFLAITWQVVQDELKQARWGTVLACGSGVEKVAAALFGLCTRICDRKECPELPITIPIGHREVAEYLGLTPPHVTRILGRFRQAGIIDLHYRALKVLDLHALAEFAKAIQG